MKSPYALAKKGKKKGNYHTISVPTDLMAQVDAWAVQEATDTGTECRSRRDAVIRIIKTVVQKEETK